MARETPLRGKVLKIGKKGRTIRFDVQVSHNTAVLDRVIGLQFGSSSSSNLR